MNEQHVTITLPLSLVQELLDARDHLQDRYIGVVPECFDALEATLLANYPDPVRVVNEAGEAFVESIAPGRELTPAEEAEYEAMLRTLWSEAGAEGRARDDRFAAFCAQAREVTEQRLHAWLDDYAEKFQRERAACTRARHTSLRGEFTAQEARA